MKEPTASRPHMPGYGIPDDTSGMLPWSWAEERLARNRNYFVATTRPDGRPHVMPVWGLWFDGTFVFSTGTDTRKVRNLAANPACAVTTESGDEPVILEGTVRFGLAEERLAEFTDAYNAKYNWNLAASQLEGLFAVVPRRVFGFIEAADQFGATATRWTFDA